MPLKAPEQVPCSFTKQMIKAKTYYMRRRPCPKCSTKEDDNKERKMTENEDGNCLNGNGHEMKEDSKNRWEHMQEELELREKRDAGDAEVGVASKTAQIGVGNVTEEDQTAAGMPPDTNKPLRAEDLVVTSGRSSLDRSPTTTDLALVDRPTVADKLGEVGETRPEGKSKAQYAEFAEGGSVAAKESIIDPKENEATPNLPWKKAVASEGNPIVSVALRHLIAGEPAGYKAPSIVEKPQESEVTEDVIVDKGLATPFIWKMSALSTSGQDAGTEIQEEPTANKLDVITSNSAYSISDHEHQNVEFAEENPVLEDSCGLSLTEAKLHNLEQAHEE